MSFKKNTHQLFKSAKPSARFVSLFLEAIYNWRSDIRTSNDLTTEEGQLNLVFWWMQWGCQMYPVSSDIGLTDHVQDIFFQEVIVKDHVTLKIFEYLWINRTDIQQSFPKDQSGNIFTEEYIAWCLRWGCVILNFNKIDHPNVKKYIKEVLYNFDSNESRATASFLQVDDPKTVSLFGVPSLNIGIGEDARLIKSSLEIKGWTVESVDRLNLHYYKKANIQIFAMPAPDILVTLASLPSDALDGVYIIASCPWELPMWPESLYCILDLFDEIWVHSDFVFHSIPEEYLYKVKKINLPVTVQKSEGFDRRHFVLDEDKFYFLFSFDYASFVQRKNPQIVAAAYERLKIKYPHIGLIFKTNNSDIHVEKSNEFKALVSKVKDIIFMDKSLTKAELHDLYRNIDCFVSLHRSEGFGRNIAEMMLLYKPVVVTDYSGNVDFCSEENSFICKSKLIPLNDLDYIFSKGQNWADVSLEVAVEQMEKVLLSDVSTIEFKTQKAYQNMSSFYSIEYVGNQLDIILSPKQ